MEKHKIRIAVFASVLTLMLIAGCICTQMLPGPPQQGSNSTPSQQGPQPTPQQNGSQPVTNACTTKDCFTSLANKCNSTNLTITEPAGVFRYSSSKDCVFTKTLVSLNDNETQEMKNLLEGKSLTCSYEKGKFDRRWVNSLIFGTEYCRGELKDILGDLLVFT